MYKREQTATVDLLPASLKKTVAGATVGNATKTSKNKNGCLNL